MFCYKNNGNTLFAVSENYSPSDGEVIFKDYASEEQLQKAFPDRAITNANKKKTDHIQKLEKDLHEYVLKQLINDTIDKDAELKKYFNDAKNAINEGKQPNWDLKNFKKQ